MKIILIFLLFSAIICRLEKLVRKPFLRGRWKTWRGFFILLVFFNTKVQKITTNNKVRFWFYFCWLNIHTRTQSPTMNPDQNSWTASALAPQWVSHCASLVFKKNGLVLLRNGKLGEENKQHKGFKNTPCVWNCIHENFNCKFDYSDGNNLNCFGYSCLFLIPFGSSY